MQFSCRPISLAAHAEKRVLQVGNTHKCVCKHDIYYYRFMCVRIFTKTNNVRNTPKQAWRANWFPSNSCKHTAEPAAAQEEGGQVN